MIYFNKVLRDLFLCTYLEICFYVLTTSGGPSRSSTSLHVEENAPECYLSDFPDLGVLEYYPALHLPSCSSTSLLHSSNVEQNVPECYLSDFPDLAGLVEYYPPLDNNVLHTANHPNLAHTLNEQQLQNKQEQGIDWNV